MPTTEEESPFKIGNINLHPSKATVSYQDLDGESERNADGYLVRQVIRRNVVKIELEFPPLPTGELNKILKALDAPEFEFTYPDPLTGISTPIRAYCGDRQMGFMRLGAGGTYKVNNIPYDGDLYDGLRVSIIEY